MRKSANHFPHACPADQAAGTLAAPGFPADDESTTPVFGWHNGYFPELPHPEHHYHNHPATVQHL
jgi:hypothetical protein